LLGTSAFNRLTTDHTYLTHS